MYYSPWHVRIWCSDTKGLLFTAEWAGAGSVSFNQHSGAIYLKSKLYSAVEIASDIVTEHGCQVCVLSPTAGSVDSPQAPTCLPRTARASASEQPRGRSVLFKQLNLTCMTWVWFHSDRLTREMMWKNIHQHLIFTFYLNRDTSVLELFGFIVFQYKIQNDVHIDNIIANRNS